MRCRPGGKPSREARGAKPPEAGGPEAQDDDLPLAGEHPIGLADHGLGVALELQRVGQQHGIDRGGLDGQRVEPGQHVHALARLLGDHRLAPDAAGGQQLPGASPAAQLQQLQAEDLIQQAPEQPGLGRDELATQRG